MKKLFCLIVLALSGCASVSEYNQGCRDGVGGMRNMFSNVVFAEPQMVEYYCNSVEHTREQKKTREKP